MDAGMAIGSFVLGIVASFAGYRSIYMIGVVLIVVTGILYFALIQKTKLLPTQLDTYLQNDDEKIAILYSVGANKRDTLSNLEFVEFFDLPGKLHKWGALSFQS